MNKRWNNGVDAGIALAKSKAVAKVAFWNMVRGMIAMIFAVIFLVFVLTAPKYGGHWAYTFWKLLSIGIVLRNVTKSRRETKRLTAVIGSLNAPGEISL